MPRSLRLQFPGVFYHVMARGNRSEAIFHDDDDWRFFLATLSEVFGMTCWRCQAGELMERETHQSRATGTLTRSGPTASNRQNAGWRKTSAR